jgi:pimeloyl-ACP methyl ester carboxylesterase
MTPQTKARLVAALAFPLFLLHNTSASAQTTAPVQAPATAGETNAQLPHITIRVVGRGSPVVLIPGLSSPAAVWDGVVPALAAHHRVHIVQVRGFAGDDPGANLQPGLLAGVVADLHGYLSQTRVKDAAVVGHSMGGLVALMLAKAHPEDVGRVMAVDALPYVGEIFAPGATVAMLEPRAKMMRDGMAAQYCQPANPAMAQAIANQNALHDDSRVQVAAWAAKADPRVTAAAFYEDMITDLRTDIAAIRAPITLVYPFAGTTVAPATEALYRGAYKAAPRTTYVPVAESGHFIMLDQPAAFAAALDAFLKP